MTTLIAVYDNDDCVGRCDARCYEATSPDCDCVCGGKNHGACLNQAIQNTSELAENIIKVYKKSHNLSDNFYLEKKTNQPIQMSLLP